MLTLFMLMLLCVAPSLASARQFVCTAGDTGCIITAIAQANLYPYRHHVIELDASTFTFDRQDNGNEVEGFTATPVILVNLTLRGVSAAETVLQRADAPDTPLFRLFHVGEGARVVIEGVTIQGGAVSPVFFNRGGAILAEGSLVVRESVIRLSDAWIGGGLHIARTGSARLVRVGITDNTADLIGGGVVAIGPLAVEDSLISDNLAESGGALATDPQAGIVVVRRSIISGNVASLVAGGGVDMVGTLELRQTLLLDNSSGLRGGAINLESGDLLLRNSACVGNTAEVFGGCLFVESGTARIQGSTITTNSIALPLGEAGGILNRGGAVQLQRSVLAGNEAATSPDCEGTIQADRRSVVGDESGCDVQR